MLPPIERGARRAVLSGSVAIALCGLLIASLAGTSSGARGHHRRGDIVDPISHLDDPWKAKAVIVTRDPFFMAPATAPDPIASANGRNLVGMRVTQGRPIVPENIDLASVRAIASGERPKAIVDVSGAAKIVGPGDFINGKQVEYILPDRIVLKGGIVLVLPRKLP